MHFTPLYEVPIPLRLSGKVAIYVLIRPSDDQIVYVNLVRAGGGIGGMLRILGDGDPALERIADFVKVPALPVWLTAVPGLRATPRIARVFDHLAAALRTLGHP